MTARPVPGAGDVWGGQLNAWLDEQLALKAAAAHTTDAAAHTGTLGRLAAANTWTADNFFGSGRPWYDLGATATPDGVYATDGVILAGSLSTLTCASAPFTSYYVGKAIVISGAGAAGASLVTTIASFVSATQVTLATAATAAVNPADVMFGTDNTTAINALFALAIGEHRITRGQYLVTAPLTLPAIAKVVGSGRRNAVILNNNSNIFNPAAEVTDSTYEHFAVVAGKGAGHIFNLGNVVPGTTQFSKLYLAQNNPTKSIFTGLGMIDVDIEYSDLYAYGARSVPIIKFVSTSTAFINDNRIRANRIEDWGTATEYMIWLETQGGGAGTNNRIIDNTLEQPTGGGMNILSMANTFIENNPAWDAYAPSTKHIVNIATSAAAGSTACFSTRIRKQSRQSGALAAGVYDINIVAGGTSQTDIAECAQGGAASSFLINVAASGFIYGTVIERCGPGVTINGYAPTLAAGGAISASPGAAISLDAGSTPYEGTVTITTGTAPTSGEIVVVTLGNNTFGAVPASVTIEGIGTRGDVVPDKNCWVSFVDVSQFKVSCLSALPASVVFKIGYKVNRRAVV